MTAPEALMLMAKWYHVDVEPAIVVSDTVVAVA